MIKTNKQQQQRMKLVPFVFRVGGELDHTLQWANGRWVWLDLSVCLRLRQNLYSWVPLAFKSQVRTRTCCPKEVDSSRWLKVYLEPRERKGKDLRLPPRVVNLRLDQGSQSRTGHTSVIFSLLGLVGGATAQWTAASRAKWVFTQPGRSLLPRKVSDP